MRFLIILMYSDHVQNCGFVFIFQFQHHLKHGLELIDLFLEACVTLIQFHELIRFTFCRLFLVLLLSLVGYEGLEVVNPDGGTEDAEEEARKGRWKQEVYYYLSLSL